MNIPDSLVIIAGRGVYPQMLMNAAREAGVLKLVVVAFRGETTRDTVTLADEVRWVRVGQLQRLLDTLKDLQIQQVIMAGQIAPSNLFNVRMDALAMSLLRELPVRNAHTIFGSLVEQIEKLGIVVLPGNSFMEPYTPVAGTLSCRAPDARERADMKLGLRLVKGTSEFEIGQTVVIREGMIIAVEAFEGTNETIKRAGKVGGPGGVVIKVPKRGHDMRFDIPVVGTRTFEVMKKAGISCLAVEAGKTILLEKMRLIELADQLDMAFVALDTKD